MYTRLCRGAMLALGVMLLNVGLTNLSQVQGDELLAPLTERFAPTVKEIDETPSFQRHVSPLLGRLGCNGRACHGSFQGRGGFQLSLFGYDFAADHKALTASESPRVDLKNPAESMILNKPTSEDEHEGGKRYSKDGWEYQVISRWIEAGALDDSPKHPKLARLEVIPAEITFAQESQQTELKVIAHWANGVQEDVTPLCRFKSNDTDVADVSESAIVKSTGQGDTHIVVFYDNGITPVPVYRPLSAEVVASYPQVPTPTKIDELVVAKLRRIGVVPSETCTDAEFLRRVSLDMTGTLPAPQEVQAFLADTNPSKRESKIDELLGRPGYAAWWTTRLCDITGNNPRNTGNNAFRGVESQQWYDWIYKRVEQNVPYDQMIAGIVEAKGRLPEQTLEEYCAEMSGYVSNDEKGNFADREYMPHYWSRRTVNKAEDKALSFAHAFLGVRIECAQCHKHPFDQWSKQDFEQFTSFFAGVQYGTPNSDRKAYSKLQESLGLKGKKGNQANKDLPKLAKEGKVIPFQEVFVSIKQPSRRGRQKDDPELNAESARILGGEKFNFEEGDDPRTALMDWMREKDNPYFAKAIVNRVWAVYFNVGIIEPADDLSLGNPPSNGPLLEWLTQEFVAHNYDMKWLHKTVALSNTYQASWRTNATNEQDTRNFSHAIPRRLPAEVALDAIQQATASDSAIAELHSGVTARAISSSGYDLPTAGGGRGRVSYALTTFGKPARETNCDCERSLDPSLLQTLFLRNDRDMLTMIDRRGGWLDSIAKENKLEFQGTAVAGQQRRGMGNKLAGTGAKPFNKANIPADVQEQYKRLRMQSQNFEQIIVKAKKKNDEKRLAKILNRQKSVESKLEELRKKYATEPTKDTQFASGNAGKEKPDTKPEQASGQDVNDSGSTLSAGKYQELIQQIYLRSVSRLPTESELERTTAYLRDAKDPAQGLKDIMWAVLNTKEFIVNH